MPSPRLTEAEVHAAMAQLDQQGQKPTITRVYDILRRGSYSTIQRMMASYDPEAKEGPETIPDPPEKAVEAIWATAYSQAWHQLAERMESSERALREAREESRSLARALDDAQQDLHATRTALNEKSEELRLALESARTHESQAFALETKLQTLEEALGDAKAERDKLWQQVQRRLELPDAAADETMVDGAAAPTAQQAWNKDLLKKWCLACRENDASLAPIGVELADALAECISEPLLSLPAGDGEFMTAFHGWNHQECKRVMKSLPEELRAAVAPMKILEAWHAYIHDA